MRPAQRLSQAVGCAETMRRLVADGRYAEADQVSRTIDELVGRWVWSDGRYGWRWPEAVRVAA